MSFVDKTIKEITFALETSFAANIYAQRSGFLQDVDARLKLAGIFLLIIFVSLEKNMYGLYLLILATLALSILSRISLFYFLKRVFIFAPLFALVLIVPSMFNMVTNGDTVIEIIRLHHKPLGIFPQHLAITKQGIYVAELLFFRIIDSISLVMLLVLTTKWTEIVFALRAFYVPWVVILILLISYRYILIFLRTTQESLLAKKSRLFNVAKPRNDYGWISNRIGLLVSRSFNASESVYQSMESRAYNEFSVFTAEKGYKINNIMWIICLVVTSFASYILK